MSVFYSSANRCICHSVYFQSTHLPKYLQTLEDVGIDVTEYDNGSQAKRKRASPKKKKSADDADYEDMPAKKRSPKKAGKKAAKNNDSPADTAEVGDEEETV